MEVFDLTISTKANLWKQHIESYRKSGLTAANWCKNNNLKLTQLRYWINIFNKENIQKEPEWIALEEPKINPLTPLIKITFKDISVEVSDGFHPETLNAVLKVLGIHV